MHKKLERGESEKEEICGPPSLCDRASAGGKKKREQRADDK